MSAYSSSLNFKIFLLYLHYIIFLSSVQFYKGFPFNQCVNTVKKTCKVIILKVLHCFWEKQKSQRSITLCAMNIDVLGIKYNHSHNQNRKRNMNDLTTAVSGFL